ncbi:DoxX family protein [Nocardia sp. NPDC050630]|uniref:DoxX family protein n=1 Tax=Nocardia sp. NPDC050630 TaxID=3364321 RepID=UPI0037900A6E
MTDALNLALLLLRLALAFLFFAHATQKLLGCFSGGGLGAAATAFEKLGQRPGKLMAIVAAVAESTSAALLAAGFATPAGAAIGAGTMLVAGSSLTHRSKTFWNATGGGEYPFVLAALSILVAFSGPGAWSLDAATGMPWNDTERWGILTGTGVLVLAAAASLPLLIATRRQEVRRR